MFAVLMLQRNITETATQKKGKKCKKRSKNPSSAHFQSEKKMKFINSHIEHLSHRLTHRWIFMAYKQIGIPIEALSWDINTTRIPLCSHCLPACRSRFFPIDIASAIQRFSDIHSRFCLHYTFYIVDGVIYGHTNVVHFVA